MSFAEWPIAIDGLGLRVAAVFSLCAVCKRRQRGPQSHVDGSWARYGDVPLCLPHARELASKEGERRAADVRPQWEGRKESAAPGRHVVGEAGASETTG